MYSCKLYLLPYELWESQLTLKDYIYGVRIVSNWRKLCVVSLYWDNTVPWWCNILMCNFTPSLLFLTNNDMSFPSPADNRSNLLQIYCTSYHIHGWFCVEMVDIWYGSTKPFRRPYRHQRTDGCSIENHNDSRGNQTGADTPHSLNVVYIPLKILHINSMKPSNRYKSGICAYGPCVCQLIFACKMADTFRALL